MAYNASWSRVFIVLGSVLLTSCHSLNFAPGSAYMVKPVQQKPSPRSTCKSISVHRPHYEYNHVPRHFKNPSSQPSVDPNKQCHLLMHRTK